MNISCESCKVQGILGTRWRCVQCPELSLCDCCYMSDKHDMNHQFVRYDSPCSMQSGLVPRLSAIVAVVFVDFATSALVLCCHCIYWYAALLCKASDVACCYRCSVVCMCVCLCVCWSQLWSLQKRLDRLRCCNMEVAAVLTAKAALLLPPTE